MPARQQHRRDPGRTTESRELRDLPSPASRQQRPLRSLALQRPRQRQVGDQPGLRSPSARLEHVHHGSRATNTSTPARRNNNDHAEEFSVTPVDTPDSFTFSGYFTLASIRTGLGVTYGTETTPGGRPRIYQDPADPSSTSTERSAEPGAFVPGSLEEVRRCNGSRSHVATLDLPETSALTMCSRPGDPPPLCSPWATRTSRWSRPRSTMERRARRARGATASDRSCATPRSTCGPGSGLEGVASDGAGTILLLQEEQARLLVFAPDLSRLLHTLVLAVPVGRARCSNPAWSRHPNSRGEGLLLLRRRSRPHREGARSLPV